MLYFKSMVYAAHGEVMDASKQNNFSHFVSDNGLKVIILTILFIVVAVACSMLINRMFNTKREVKLKEDIKTDE